MLYAYKREKADIFDICLEIEELKEAVQGLTGKGNNEIMQSSPTNKTSDPVTDEIMRKEEEIDKLIRIKRGKERYVSRIDNMMTILTDEERSFIDLKYFQGKKGKVIETALGLSRDGVSSRRKLVISDLVDFINNTKNTQKTHINSVD